MNDPNDPNHDLDLELALNDLDAKRAALARAMADKERTTWMARLIRQMPHVVRVVPDPSDTLTRIEAQVRRLFWMVVVLLVLTLALVWVSCQITIQLPS